MLLKMSKSKVEIVPTDYLDSETLSDVDVLYDRVRRQQGGLDPTMYSPDELVVFNRAIEVGALSHPTFYSEDTLPSSFTEPNTIHYLAIQNAGRKSERTVGHGVIRLANPDYTETWANGARDLEPDLGSGGTPLLLELGGAVVDPDRQGTEIWSGLIESRLYDISHDLGGIAVVAVNQHRTDVMAKMAEFGGVVVGRSGEESDGALNLLVFPAINPISLKYISPEKIDLPAISLSPAVLASEVDSERRALLEL
jgi:hypothetical protein